MEYKSDEKEDKNFITKIWTSRGKITDVSREGDSQEGKKVETWSRNLFCPRLLGKPTFQKSAVFFNIVQRAFAPPPFYLNICPILQGVFFNVF